MIRFLRTSFLPLALLTILCAPFAHTQSLLWKVSGNGLEQPSYLFGTIHAACAEDIHVPDSMLTLIESCDRLVLELDLADERLRASMGMIAFMPNDTMLTDLLSQEEYRRLSDWFKSDLDMSLDRMNNIRPLFFVGLIMQKAMNCRMTSYEEVFMNAMTAMNKEIDGIETPEEQLEAFSQISLKAQAGATLQMIDSLPALRTELEKIQRVYDSGDIEALYGVVQNSLVEYGRYDKQLLSDRNHRWIPRIREMMKNRPVFIAVGAGHLAGPDGVLALLKKEGYRVAPLRIPGSSSVK